MTPHPFARRAVIAVVALVAMLLAVPSAALGLTRALDGPKNLRVAAMAPHSLALAWDPAVNSGSFTYVIEASFGYRVGVPQTQTSYTWTRDLIPGKTYSFVMWAGDSKGREPAKSNKVTVTLPVDTTAPAAPVVRVSGTTSSTVGLAWDPVTDDDYTCCTYRVLADGVRVSDDNLQWTGERAVTVLRLAAGTTHSFTIVAVDPSGNASAPSAAATATTQATRRHDGSDGAGQSLRVRLRLRDVALLGPVRRRRRPAGRDPLRDPRQRRLRRRAERHRALDHLRHAVLEHVQRAGGRQRRQPLSDELDHPQQPGLLSDHRVDGRPRGRRRGVQAQPGVQA